MSVNSRRRWGGGPRRHPLEVTADRLGDHYERYYEHFDGRTLDEISHVIHVLREIAEGNEPDH